VAIYTADIQIAVRGATQVTNLQQRLNALSTNVNQLNASLRGNTAASLNNLNNLVSQSDRIMRSAAQGTRVQREAIDAYVRSTAAAERAEVSLQRAIAGRRRELGLAASTTQRAGRGGGSFGSRIGGAVSGGIIGGSFPLLFGQGAGAATGGAIGGVAGGLFGPGGSFAGSLLGTLIGDIASKGQAVKKLGEDIGFSAEQTRLLEGAFKQAGSEFDKFESSVQNIRGLSLGIEDQANAIRLVSTLTQNYGGEIDKVTNAYTSALESGKVTQATLNQLTSQGIPIQQALADKYKVSRSEILQMAKDGKISVQELSDTLVEMGNKGVTETNKTKSGFDVLKTSVISLGSELAGLGKSIVGIFEGPFNWLLKTLGQIIQTSSDGIASLRDLLNFSTPAGEKAKAALQAGRLPAGPEGVIDVIGEKRYRELGKQAGPAFMGLGVNLEKFQKLLQQQPEFQAAKPAPIKNIQTPGQLPPSGAGAKGPKPPEDRTAQLTEEFNAIVAIGQAEDRIRDLLFDGRELLAAEVELQKQIADIERDRNKALINANYESERVVITKIAEARIVDAQLKQQDEIREINQKRFEQELQIQEAVRSSVQAFTDMRTEQELQVQYSKTYYRLLAEGVLPAEAERIANFEKTVAAQLKAVDTQLLITNAAIIEAKARGANTVELQKELDLLEQKRKAIEGEARTGPGLAAPEATPAEKITEKIGKLKEEIAALTNIGNIAITVADGIGAAFANAFTGLISGSMTAKEALGSFFKSVGDMFLDMAAQIIAKQMTMIILQTILKALGAFGGGGGGGGGGNAASALGSNPNVAAYAPLAKGGTFGNGVAAFAKGGTFSNSVVSSPTLFKFADGGTTRTGLMGEAGPEAIMPLKRGSDGSLGVQATGLREAMGRPPGGANGSPVLNMSFQSTTINGTEYVSRDQLEAAMAQTRRQAAKDGANRGMTMTLDKIQNSPSTRSRVGIR
jgi:tape measure domain-containing protein